MRFFFGANRKINTLSSVQLLQFKSYLQSRKLSPQTIKHCISLLQRVLNFSIHYGLCDMAIPKIRLRSYDNRRVRFLSKSEAKKLLEELRQNLLWHDITAIALYTGLRAGEIFSLHKSSLDIQNRYIHIFDTKSTLNRSIYLNAQALEVVQRHACLNRPYLFFNDQTCSPIRFVSRIFTSAIERAGLNPPDVDRRNKVVFHTLRHTFASWLVQDGTPLAVVAQLLGHANIRMTMRYAHLAPSQGINHLTNLAI